MCDIAVRILCLLHVRCCPKCDGYYFEKHTAPAFERQDAVVEEQGFDSELQERGEGEKQKMRKSTEMCLP